MDTGGRSSLSVEADRARRLFLYLRQLAELRAKTVRDLASYELVEWFADVPAGGFAWSIFAGNDERDAVELWLEVDRVELPKPPTPDNDLGRWIARSNLRNADLEEPGLLEPGDGERPEVPVEIGIAYQRFVDTEWRPWRDQFLELRPSYQFYSKLFSMSERRSRLGEVYELVIGLGLLVWQRGDHMIKRHLITSPVEISVDPETGRISVVPSESEGRNRFELDMLDSEDRGNASSLQELSDEVHEADPLELTEKAVDILRRWMHQAHANGVVSESLTAPQVTPDPQVSLAPALILRKRGQRTLAQLLEDIADRIEEDGELAAGIQSLVTTDGAESYEGLAHLSDTEVYFPLPANDEQQHIVQRMATDHGVLVQGPPGTGKSHTIANLISHLLAHGKRVLVTSHTDRALRVLRDKLPDEIAPLCISLLGSDRDSIRALEGAVAEISSRKADWSETATEAELEAMRIELHDVRERAQLAISKLREIRESETLPIAAGRYSGTRQHIATALSEQRSLRGWISGSVSVDKPPLSNAEFNELVELSTRLEDEAVAAADADLPDPSVLVKLDDLAELVEREVLVEAAYQRALQTSGDWIDELASASETQIKAANLAIEQLANTLARVRDGWASEAAQDALEDRLDIWRALRERAANLQEQAAELADTTSSVAVDVTVDGSPHTLRARATELLEHARDKGELRTGLFAASVIRRNRVLIDGASVDGRPPKTVDALSMLVDWLELESTLAQLEEEWVDRVSVPGRLSNTQRVAAFSKELRQLDVALSLEGLLATARETSRRLPHFPELDWADVSRLREICQTLTSALDHREIESINRRIGEALDEVGPGKHVALKALRGAIADRNVEAFRSALMLLAEHRDLAKDENRRRDLHTRLAADAPDLAGGLTTNEHPSRPTSDFETAWAWAFADGYLQGLNEPGEAVRIAAAVEDLESRERVLLARLAASMAWQRMFRGMKNEHAMALNAWSVAVRRIGRGTGKYAAQHRRTARQYMSQARDAIPAWIMPMYRVAENLDASPGAFDVVIVDEASQSGVESLFLFHLAKQVVIVGDDQQIAPEAVGIDQQEVMTLQQQLIPDLPYKELFNPTNSLFDQATVRFPGAIALREHFRCMPEIIEFSNRIAYQHRTLIPLRQFGSDRLDPIKTVHLPHGYREGGRQAINRSEANEIVERICKLCADPRYDGFTIGVVSLQGDYQSRLIESMLLDRLGPQEMLERRMVCGNAYAFQGDERNVVFLSMVAAPNERIGARSGEADKRRFNVAASRAQDQVWLVHSVRLEDLGETDMRRSLLSYYLDPEVEHLEELNERDWTIKQPEFDSMFEQDVYVSLRERGYRVAPQLRVAGYRIDLVVEGAHGRLAVECDGDRWHGPDQWDSDMLRQRRLERCGWRFVRIRGSEFYRDRDAAIKPLWRELGRGIEPGGYSSFDRWEVRESPITGPEDGVSEALELVSIDPEPEPQSSADAEVSSSIGDRLTSSQATATSNPDAYPEPLGDNSDDAVPLDTEAARTGARPAQEEARSRTPSPDEGLWPDDLPRLSLGQRVVHSRLGEARVAGVTKAAPPSDDQPFVRLRFSNGQVHEYSPAEYRQAAFIPPSVVAEHADSQSIDGLSPEPYERHGVVLRPYDEWVGEGAPDPRDEDHAELGRWAVRMIEREAPVTTDRLFSLMIKAAGFQKVTGPVRSSLNRTIHRLRNQLDVVEFENPETAWPQRVLTLEGEPRVVARERGPRDLYEMPLNEIAQVFELLQARLPLSSETSLVRYVLDVYDLHSRTRRRERYLDAARRIAVFE